MNTPPNTSTRKRITVVGAGYVGLSNAVLLAQHNTVTVLDIAPFRVNKINNRESPIVDEDLKTFLQTKSLDIVATTDTKTAYNDADYIVVATPTNYDQTTNYFDTSTVNAVIDSALTNAPNALIVIKSTIPVGYVEKIRHEKQTDNVIFAPEFLREGQALKDNLYPSRIIIGERSERAAAFASLLSTAALIKDIPIFFTDPTEAEAIKLFANTYLAMRVAYFNELDTFSAIHKLSPRQIIDGVCSDPRIGDHYNNPSFGYGGYCLPKDTKQLLANYQNAPQRLISAVVASNQTRKAFIAQDVLQLKPKTVGIHRLAMKTNSDNFRDSSVLDIIDTLIAHEVNVIIYEPELSGHSFRGASLAGDLSIFKHQSDLILANRRSPEIADVSNKVYTRDIYDRD